MEEHRAYAYETEFAMLIGTSVIQVVPGRVTLIYFQFNHPYGCYNVTHFLPRLIRVYANSCPLCYVPRIVHTWAKIENLIKDFNKIEPQKDVSDFSILVSRKEDSTDIMLRKETNVRRSKRDLISSIVN